MRYIALMLLAALSSGCSSEAERIAKIERRVAVLERESLRVRSVTAPSVRLDAPSSGEDSATAHVMMHHTGRLYVDGSETREADLVERIRARVARDPGLRVVIAADERVSHGRVIAVVDRIKQAGVARVSFNVRPNDP